MELSVKCISCRAKMPIGAKFCGFCGHLLMLPIVELFEPGAFIVYKDLGVGGSGYMRYKVLRTEDNIIEFEVTRAWKSSDSKDYYLYVGKDRLLRKSTSFLPKRYKGPLETLRPVKKFTSLWIDVNKIDVGDVVMISYTPHIVDDVNKEGGREFYILKPIDREVSLYYDKGSGLLWKVVENGEETRLFHSAWKTI